MIKSVLLVGVIWGLASPLLATEIAVSPGDSLEQARDQAKAGDTVVLNDGVYRLSKPLLLGPEHSGVTWRAAEGATPIISGGVTVTGWVPDRDGVWKAKLDRPEKIRQLIVNGERAQMAMTKKLVPAGVGGEFSWEGTESWVIPGRKGKTHGSVMFKCSEVPPVAQPEDLELLQYRGWSALQFELHGMQKEGEKWAFIFRAPGAMAMIHRWQSYKSNNHPHQKTWLLNAREFINQPGEFCFETTSKTLYYKPRTGEDMAKAVVVAPVLQTLVSIKGSDLTTHVSHVTFEGITFSDTRWSLMPIGDSHGDVAIQGCALDYKAGSSTGHDCHYANEDIPHAAVAVTAADHITFKRNRFLHTGCIGLNMENDVLKSEIAGNTFLDIGNCSINIGHPQHVYIGKQNGDNEGWGPYNINNSNDKYDEEHEGLCRRIAIRNNLIRNTGGLSKGSVALCVFYGHGIEIEHNDIYGAPYTGISLGWGWQNWNGTQRPHKPSLSLRDNLVRFNKIGKVMQTLHDGGGIYLLANSTKVLNDTSTRKEKIARIAELRGNPARKEDNIKWTPICGNYMYDFGGTHRSGIHADNGSWFFEFYDNVFDLKDPWSLIKVSSINQKGHYRIHDNYSSTPLYWVEKKYNRVAPDTVIRDNHEIKDGKWPEKAIQIMAQAGLELEYQDLLTSPDVIIESSRSYEIKEPKPDRYEAEEAALSGGSKVNTNHGAYSGTGFVDGYHKNGSASTSFTVTAPTAGTYHLTVRYCAAAGTSSNVGLHIDGQKVTTLICKKTKTWNTWADHGEAVTLKAGENSIELKAERASGAPMNIDYITLLAE